MINLIYNLWTLQYLLCYMNNMNKDTCRLLLRLSAAVYMISQALPMVLALSVQAKAMESLEVGSIR
jgi:hypothetical protein